MTSGYLPGLARTLTIAVQRANNSLIPAGVCQKLTSAVIPLYVRRSPRVESALALFYLHGLSTGDFRGALSDLLGPGGRRPAAQRHPPAAEELDR